jgi:hypothetical protein
MAKALDQIKEVRGSILVHTMLTNLTMLTIANFDYGFDNDICWLRWPMVCIMTYNTIMFYVVVYTIIRFVNYIIHVQTICIWYINKKKNLMNIYFVKSILKLYFYIYIYIYIYIFCTHRWNCNGGYDYDHLKD